MHDPIARFNEWLALAKSTPSIKEPTAMTLATATTDGAPAARIVLLKAVDASGFVFYGNMESRKFTELKNNPRAALCFHWMPLERQVRIEGSVARVSDEEADAYFNSRPRGRQLGAWASEQSRPLANREELEARNAMFEKQFEGVPVPRPPHWSGWRLAPLSIEFWINSDLRLHEREIYRRISVDAPWQHGLMYP
jgi:pyridoxamine 5'-phosphate oxidase